MKCSKGNEEYTNGMISEINGATMRPHVLSIVFLFAALLLLSQPVMAANFCTIHEMPGAVAIAQVVFSGQITRVERDEDPDSLPGGYWVTFKVDTWWKGNPSPEMIVLWRTSFMNCELGVGEVGESYLVFADESISIFDNQPPEVTVFNRTSKMPAKWEPETFMLSGWNDQPRLNPKPEVNRADASADLKLLRVLRQCSCVSTKPADNATWEDARRPYDSSLCQTCLRSRLKYYW